MSRGMIPQDLFAILRDHWLPIVVTRLPGIDAIGQDVSDRRRVPNVVLARWRQRCRCAQPFGELTTAQVFFRHCSMLDREGVASPADNALVGGPAAVEAQLRRLAEGGVTDLFAVPIAADVGAVERTIDFLAGQLWEPVERGQASPRARGSTARPCLLCASDTEMPIEGKGHEELQVGGPFETSPHLFTPCREGGRTAA
jgi:hypothetical protein